MRDESPNPGAAIVFAGTLCGILDGLAAVGLTLYYHGKPEWTFQGIARGLVGNWAYAEGIATVFIGAVLHFLIAYGAAVVYYIASRYLRIMVRQALVCGMIYGVLVHLFMQFVVIPMSKIGPHPINWRSFLQILAIHIGIVGPSISLVVRRYSGAR
jgi:hypothetical protein